MNTPLVSIIIPTYNRAHLIGETLDSIIAQSYTNWECIVVDDGSTDHSDEVMNVYLKKDSRFKYYHRPSKYKKGGNGARNFGFEMCNGKYVNWFDSDDLMLNDFLKIGVEDMIANQLDFILFDYRIFSHKTGEIIKDQINKTDNLIEDYVTFKINIGTTTIIWDKKLISNFRFNENLTKAQDLDFNFRILTSTTYKWKNANQFGFLVRGHTNSIVQEYKRNNVTSIISELYSRKNVFRYMSNKGKSKEVLTKCFELYYEPLIKLIRAKKHFLVFKELTYLITINNQLFLKNMGWFLKATGFLLVFSIFNKGEYRLKHAILNFNYC